MNALRITNTRDVLNAIHLNAKSSNTRILHNSHLTEFKKVTGFGSFPIPMEVAKGYLFYLASKGAKYGTIKSKADSLHSAHKGNHSPFASHEMKEFVKGLKNTMQANDRQSVTVKHSQPISKDLLLRKVDELNRLGTKKALRDRTIIILGFLGAFRVSELQNLRYSDLSLQEEGCMINLYESKNLQAGEVGQKWFPVSKSSLCPINAINNYLEVFNRSNDEYLFNSFAKGDKEQPTPMTRRGIQKLIKSIFGVEYSAHSLRSGFVTEALTQGATHSQVMQQTLHKTVAGLMPYDQTDKVKNNAVNSLI